MICFAPTLPPPHKKVLGRPVCAPKVARKGTHGGAKRYISGGFRERPPQQIIEFAAHASPKLAHTRALFVYAKTGMGAPCVANWRVHGDGEQTGRRNFAQRKFSFAWSRPLARRQTACEPSGHDAPPFHKTVSPVCSSKYGVGTPLPVAARCETSETSAPLVSLVSLVSDSAAAGR